MNRLVTVLVAALLLAGAVPAAASLGGTTGASDAEPGATFAGVVAVQGAEVHNEVESRTLDQRLERASSANATAAVVADETERIDARLTDLEARKERVTRAYENGSISKGRYEAELAAIAAQVRALERRANRTGEVAADLPEAALEAHGVNVSAVRAVAHRADELGGGEVAAAARGVAGEDVGGGLGAPPAVGKNRTGSDDNPGNGKDGGETGKPDDVGVDATVGTGVTPGPNGSVGANATVADGDYAGENAAGASGGNGTRNETTTGGSNGGASGTAGGDSDDHASGGGSNRTTGNATAGSNETAR